MLVPAIAFGWWLVSMSSPQPHRPLPAAMSERARATASATDLQEQPDDSEAADEATASEVYDDAEVPAGAGERVPLKVVTPEIVRAARTFLDLPMGSERSQTIGDRRYVFVLERHYHPPGFVGGPHGWHKGVTVYGVR